MRSDYMRFVFSCLVIAFVFPFTASALAQFEPEPAGKGPRLDKSFTQRYRVGVKISSGAGPCRGLIATIPVPTDWPEQQVRIDDEEIGKAVRSVRYIPLGDGVKQMVVTVPFLPAGQLANALVTCEITRFTTLPPADTTIFQMPKKLVLAERRYLGTSPLIESRHGDIRKKAREVLDAQSEADAWKQVEALYDFVRDNHTFQNGKLKGAVQTLRDESGNEEDLHSLFIALCRASDIPARTVWIPDGAYAEFMLADDEGENHWIPCKLTGEREFGGVKCEFPILQKGDNFDVPQRKEPVRFVPEFIKGTGGRPSIEFVRMPLPK